MNSAAENVAAGSTASDGVAAAGSAQEKDSLERYSNLLSLLILLL